MITVTIPHNITIGDAIKGYIGMIGYLLVAGQNGAYLPYSQFSNALQIIANAINETICEINGFKSEYCDTCGFIWYLPGKCHIFCTNNGKCSSNGICDESGLCYCDQTHIGTFCESKRRESATKYRDFKDIRKIFSSTFLASSIKNSFSPTFTFNYDNNANNRINNGEMDTRYRGLLEMEVEIVDFCLIYLLEIA